MPIRRFITSALFVLSGISGLFLWYFGFSQNVEEIHGTETVASPDVVQSMQSTRTVRVAELKQEHTQSIYGFPSVVEAAENARITSLVVGYFSTPGIKLGQEVKTGDPLAKIYNPQLAPTEAAAVARLKEAQVRLAQSERDHKRVNRLAKRGAVSESELEQAHAVYDAAVATVEAAQAQLVEARKLLSEAVIRAPFNGTVDRIFFENGEYVNQGQPVFELSGLSSLELEVEVPEKLVTTLDLRDEVSVVFPYLNGMTLPGQIMEKSASSRIGQLFSLVITLPSHPSVLPGMSAEVQFAVADVGQLMTPIQAIVDPSGGAAKIFVLNESASKVRAVPVAVDRIRGAFVSVTGDLQQGDRIVVAGQHNLIDGQAVKVLMPSLKVEAVLEEQVTSISGGVK